MRFSALLTFREGGTLELPKLFHGHDLSRA
jgi:hypothetical protein